MDNPDHISPNGATTFNLVANDALLPNIKKILSYCQIRPGNQKNDCLILLLNHLASCSEEEIIMLQAYALQLIINYPKIKGLVFRRNVRYPNELKHWNISTVESSKAFIADVEVFLQMSLGSLYGTSVSADWMLMRSSFMSRRMTVSSLVRQMLEEFDWSQSLVSSSSKRQHSCDSLELVCCHPRRRKLSTSEPLPEDLSFSTDCQCIHCFLHDSFPLTTIERSLIALNPSDLGNNIFFSFDLSSDEVNSVRQGNLRLCMYVVNRFADTWNLDSSRFRMIMNGVDVFSTQSVMVKNQYFLDKLIRTGKNSCSIYYTMSPYIYLAFYLNKVISISHFIKEFGKNPIPSIDQSKADFFKLIDDDDDIDVDESLQYSLLDPLTKLRMEIPVRSVKCGHLPCFDLKTFLDMYSTKEKMLCPVCYQQILLEDLKKDWFVDSILKETTEDDDEVSIKKDGTWKVIERNEKDSEEEEESDHDHSLEQMAVETLQSLPTSRIRLSRQYSIRDFYGMRNPFDETDIPMQLPRHNTSDYSQRSWESDSHIPSPNRSKEIQDDTIIDLVSDSDSSQDIRQSHQHTGNDDIIDIIDYFVF